MQNTRLLANQWQFLICSGETFSVCARRCQPIRHHLQIPSEHDDHQMQLPTCRSILLSLLLPWLFVFWSLWKVWEGAGACCHPVEALLFCAFVMLTPLPDLDRNYVECWCHVVTVCAPRIPQLHPLWVPKSVFEVGFGPMWLGSSFFYLTSKPAQEHIAEIKIFCL